MNTTIQKSIAEILEAENLLPEEVEELLLRVGALIYQNVMTRAVESLTDEEQNKFEKILDKQSEPEEIFTFLKNKVPGFEEIIKEESEKFRNKSAKIMGQIG
ncbi:MAG: DUF5663 domain-containing protein [bacterium]|nr:DUF5663 domain-containing protein [bacterium]